MTKDQAHDLAERATYLKHDGLWLRIQAVGTGGVPCVDDGTGEEYFILWDELTDTSEFYAMRLERIS